jgi:hypothetical protein
MRLGGVRCSAGRPGSQAFEEISSKNVHRPRCLAEMAKTDITLITVGIHPPASQRQASHSFFSQVSWTSVCIGLKLEVVATNPWAGKQSRQQQQQRGAGRNDFSIHYRGRTDGPSQDTRRVGLMKTARASIPFRVVRGRKKAFTFGYRVHFVLLPPNKSPRLGFNHRPDTRVITLWFNARKSLSKCLFFYYLATPFRPSTC